MHILCEECKEDGPFRNITSLQLTDLLQISPLPESVLF